MGKDPFSNPFAFAAWFARACFSIGGGLIILAILFFIGVILIGAIGASAGF